MVDISDRLVERAALELVHLHSLDEVERVLVGQGASASDAQKLVLFIPSAFAREYFEPTGIQFPDQFLVGPRGRFKSKAYAAEPIYVSARQLARCWIAESRTSLVMRILDWSAEANAIKKAKAENLTPSRMSEVHHGLEA